MYIAGKPSWTATAAWVLVLAVAAVGCRGVTENGHVTPSAMRVDVAGETVVEADASQAQGSISLTAGTSVPVAIIFLDADGTVIEVGPDHYVEVSVLDATVADVDPRDSPAGAVQLDALAAGTTNVAVRLMHGRIGGRAHADWIAAPFEVQVVD